MSGNPTPNPSPQGGGEQDPEKNDWSKDLPFPRRWLGYIAMKVVALVIVVYLALKWQGLL